jgi:hypothetical protein
MGKKGFYASAIPLPEKLLRHAGLLDSGLEGTQYDIAIID